MSSLEIDTSELDDLFQILDGGDGWVTYDEFIHGIPKMRGLAKRSDATRLLKYAEKIYGKLDLALGKVGTSSEAPPRVMPSTSYKEIDLKLELVLAKING